MAFGSTSLWLGVAAALLVGFSKTGLPGASIPAVALMAAAFPDDTRLSVGALLPVLLCGDLFAIRYYRRDAQWSQLWQLFPFVIAGMIPGYLVLWKLPSDGLRVLLGVVVLVLLALYTFQRWYGAVHWLEAKWFNAMMGILAGFGTTIGNAAGPVMSIFLVTRRMGKQEFLGTSAWFFFLVNLSKIPFFSALGMINTKTLQFDLLLIPMLACGAVLGARTVKWIPQAAFHVLVLGLAGIAAFRMILPALQKMVPALQMFLA